MFWKENNFWSKFFLYPDPILQLPINKPHPGEWVFWVLHLNTKQVELLPWMQQVILLFSTNRVLFCMPMHPIYCLVWTCAWFKYLLVCACVLIVFLPLQHNMVSRPLSCGRVTSYHIVTPRQVAKQRLLCSLMLASYRNYSSNDKQDDSAKGG